MAHCFVEFGAYGAIDDFECDEMTEEEIYEMAQEIIDEFVSDEISLVIVDNMEDY